MSNGNGDPESPADTPSVPFGDPPPPSDPPPVASAPDVAEDAPPSVAGPVMVARGQSSAGRSTRG